MEGPEKYYQRGLKRVARVVEGVPEYDGILGPKRLGRSEYPGIMEAYQAGKVDAAASRMADVIRGSRLTVYRVPQSARIISFAKTHNNRIQLGFLAQKTAPWRSVDICEVSTCESDRSSRIGSRFTLLLEAQLRTFLLGRANLSRSLIHQLIAYSSSYCSMLRTLKDAHQIRGLIVANDHSPTPVAVSMVCAMRGIPRAYLQHAEVTSIFPPLDFEYSILMNRRSEVTYRAIGEPLGRVAVVPRCSSPVDEEAICQRIALLRSSKEAIVGLYPSSIFNLDRLHRVVALLKANSLVSKIFLKTHPSVDANELARVLEVEPVTETPREPHVSIVGNSSVALQLAVAGNLVFQDFFLDTVAPDYYGFVAEGLTMDLEIDQLAESFWRDAGCASKLLAAVRARLGETEHRLGQSEEAYLFKRLAIELGGALRPGMDPRDELRTHLSLFPRTFFSLCRRQTTDSYDQDLSSIVELDALFNDRVLDLNALYAYIDEALCRSVIDFWFLTKRVEWAGLRLSEAGVESYRQFARAYAGTPKVKRWMESKVFDVLLRSGEFTALEDFLSHASHFTVQTAHLNRKIAFLNACASDRSLQSRFSRFYDYDHDDRVDELGRLKISVQCMMREGGKLIHHDYREVERRFLALAPNGVADEYAALVAPVFDRISGRDGFVDVKRQGERASALLNAVCTRLRAGRPFSLVRLSDGEGYLFQGTNSFFSTSDSANRERHWWGTELDSVLREEVVSAGLEAVRSADVLGIPTIYRFLRDHSSKSVSILSSIQGRGLVAVLHGVEEYASRLAEFSDDKVNLAVFNRQDSLDSLVACAKRVVVVTGAKESVVSEALGKLKDLEVIAVPTHNKTSGNSRFHFGSKPLPFVFSSIRDQVIAASGPGVLVLVGAGVAGKCFVHAAKAAGGVGLDLGSALDELVDAGIHSLH